jgi:hypothetical protein
MPRIKLCDKTSRGGLNNITPGKPAESCSAPPPGAEQLSIPKPEVGERKVLIVAEEHFG